MESDIRISFLQHNNTHFLGLKRNEVRLLTVAISLVIIHLHHHRTYFCMAALHENICLASGK